MEHLKRGLMRHGMLLFIFGLLIGFVVPQFTNPRMGLTAHLEGVMNGTFLIALGAAWGEVHLATRTKVIAYWTALYGTYANWAATTLAAIFGTGTLSPQTAPGRVALPWQETLVTVMLMSCGVAILTACVLSFWGLRAKAKTG